MNLPDTFSAWTIAFLIAAMQGFFVALMLWRWKNGHRLGNRLLAVLMSLFGLTMLEYVLYWTQLIQLYPHWMNVSLQFPLLFGPVLYLYFRCIYGNEKLRRRDLWHFLSFVVGVLTVFPFYLLDGAAKVAIASGERNSELNPILVKFFIWFRIAHLIGYAVWNFWFIQNQPQVGQSAKWGRLLNFFFLGYALAYLSYFILSRFPFFNLDWDYHISAAMTAFIYLIAYAGWAQPAVFQGFKMTEPAAAPHFEKYKNSGLTPAAGNSIAQKLAEIMENEKLYQNPELRLDDLAERLGAGKHHVSQVINEHLGKSFFDYINSLRVEEARKMLAGTSKQEMNIIEIAYAVGFNNKMSFNNTFKKTTGMTPTEFRRTAN